MNMPTLSGYQMYKYIALIFTILALIISNCNRNNMENNNKNQSLRINYFSSSSSFDPHLSKDISDSSVCKALYEGLTRKNAKGEIELAAANNLVISKDKKTYIFTLKDTKWSNNEKLTAYHFVNAWEIALDPEKSKCLHVKRLFNIKNAEKVYKNELLMQDLGVKALNDTTIIVELNHPAPFFLELLSDPIFSPIYDLNKDPTVFNGPYIVKEFEREKHLILALNPLYWDRKTVKLKEIRISFIKDEKTAFAMFEKGELDWIGSPFSCIPHEVIDKIYNLKSQATCSPFWIFFNCKNPKFKSIKIRKALSFAINRSEIVNGVVPYHKELFTILPTDLSLLDENIIAQDNTLEKAEKLFEEGLKELQIEKANFEIILDHSNVFDHEKLAEYLKNQWEKIFKIKVKLKKGDWKSFYSNIRSGKYEMGGFYVCNIIDDPEYLLNVFIGNGVYNTYWNNELYQKHLNAAVNSLEDEKRKFYLKKVEQLLLDEMPAIPIYNQYNLYLCNDNLKNLIAPKFSYMDFKYAYFE
jgi:oligopeptide transport system substrate-binding protein